VSLVLDHVGLSVGDTPVISDVSLSLEPGTIKVLLGPTLAGKTTLMRLMAGLDRPTTGRILANDVDVTRLDRSGRPGRDRRRPWTGMAIPTPSPNGSMMTGRQRIPGCRDFPTSSASTFKFPAPKRPARRRFSIRRRSCACAARATATTSRGTPMRSQLGSEER